MTYYDEIRNIGRLQNGIITAASAAEKGIPSWYLSKMVRNGELQRVARGIYREGDGDYDEYYFFQLQNKRCIYSFASALYLLEMTDRVPYRSEVTVYKGYNSSHISEDVLIHHVNKEIYELGITECQTVFGNRVRVYDRERTVCDLIAHRSKIDTEMFSKAIRAYVQNAEKDYMSLRRYAGKMHIAEKVDQILEVV